MPTNTDIKPTQADLERNLKADLAWCLCTPWADIPRHPERKLAWAAAIRRALAAEAEVARLQEIVQSLADRAAAQSELLTRLAEPENNAGQRLAEAVRLLRRIIDARPHKGEVHLAIVEAEEWGWATKLIRRT